MTEKLVSSQIIRDYIKQIKNLKNAEDYAAIPKFINEILTDNVEYINSLTCKLKDRNNSEDFLSITNSLFNISKNLNLFYQYIHQNFEFIDLASIPMDRIFLELSVSYYKLKKYDLVIQAVDQYGNLENELKGTDNQYTSGLNFLLANVYMNLENFSKVIELLNKVLSIEPNHKEANYAMSMSLIKIGENDQSKKFVKKTLQLDPKSVNAKILSGYIYYEQNNFAAAEREYLEAIKLDPSSAEAHNNMGMSLKAREKYDEAIKYYKMAERLDPNWSAPCNNIANILVLNAEYDQARKWYEIALKRNPNNAWMYNHNIAGSYVLQDKFDDAIKCYESTLKSDPNNKIAHLYIGLILLSQDKHYNSLKYLEKAIEISPANKSIQHHLGYAYLKTNNFDQALYYLKLSADQNYADAQFELGLCYLNGVGVEKNQKKAIKLFTKAKNQNHEASTDILNVLLGNIPDKADVELFMPKEQDITYPKQEEFDQNAINQIIEEERFKTSAKKLKEKIKKDFTKTQKHKQPDKLKQNTDTLTNDFAGYFNVTHPNNPKSVLKVKIDEESSEISKLIKYDNETYLKLKETALEGKFVRALGKPGFKCGGKNILKVKICKNKELWGEIIKKDGIKTCILDRVKEHKDRHKSC